MNWKTIDIMSVIHKLGADKFILLKDMDDEKRMMLFKTMSPYIRVRIAAGAEKKLFASDAECLIVRESMEKGTEIVEGLTVEQLYDRCDGITLDTIYGKLKFKKNFMTVGHGEFDYLKCLAAFDSGTELFCVSEEGAFKGFFDEHSCKESFVGQSLPKISPFCLERKEGQSAEEEKKEAAVLLKDNFLLRIPVSDNGQIIGYYDSVNNSNEEIDLKYIEKADVLSLFENYHHIMLGSESCNYGGIMDMLGADTEITVLRADNISRIFDGSIDLMICTGEPVGGLPIPCYGIEQIILDLLTMAVIRKTEQEKASLRLMYIPKKKQVPGWQFRIGGVTGERDYHVTYRDGDMAVKQNGKEYYSFVRYKNGMYGYEDFKTDTITIRDGMRRVFSDPEKETGEPARRVYLVGYCPLLGAFSRDDNIIASELQKLLYGHKNKCKVLQYVCPPLNSPVQQLRSEINVYTYLMNMSFKKGDIICITGLNSFNGILEHRRNVKTYYAAQVFHCYRKEKCFADNSLSHLNSEGNRVFAKWIYEEVIYDLLGKQ